MTRNKKHLRALSEQRQKSMAAPNFGFTEKAFFQLQKQVQELVKSNNNLVQELERLKNEKIDDRALEAHVMCVTIFEILEKNKMITQEEIKEMLKQTQFNQQGLGNKVSGVAEKGDVIIMNFKLFDQEDNLVDDRSKEMLAYEVGSGQLPCDDAMMGIRKGETRMCDVVFDNPNFKNKALIGKTLKMQVTCIEVRTNAKPEPRKEMTKEALLKAQQDGQAALNEEPVPQAPPPPPVEGQSAGVNP